MKQTRIFDAKSDPVKPVKLANGGWYSYHPALYVEQEATELFEALRDEIAWESHSNAATRGKPQPRLIKWIGDFDYTYTRLTLRKFPWGPRMSEIRKRVEELVFGESTGQFQGVLLNYYRDGNDSIGFHSDSEETILSDSPIAALSFGAQRRFILSYTGKNLRRPKNVHLDLESGSCLIMGGTSQRFWQHSVPKQPRIKEGRISLTFRQYHLASP